VDKKRRSRNLRFVHRSDNHPGFNKPTNSAVIASVRTLITQEQTIEDQVAWKTKWRGRPPNPACIA
jgi:hypothetical protein